VPEVTVFPSVHTDRDSSGKRTGVPD